ncbi:MAG: 50S ribosomal protein L24 [Candidatus Woesearchaeota archaeon]
MKNRFSRSWKSSKQPRKQRKYQANAPLHLKGKFLAASLSKALRQKYGIRSLRIRKGDTVKILRGQFKGKITQVTKVLLKRTRIYLADAYQLKKDGSKSFYPVHPSNVQLVELQLDDKKRLAISQNRSSSTSAQKPTKPSDAGTQRTALPAATSGAATTVRST